MTLVTVNEGSSYSYEVPLLDAGGNLITPTLVRYRLMGNNGVEIIPWTSLASGVTTISILGLDNTISEVAGKKRYLTTKVYYGSDQTLSSELTYTLVDLKGVDTITLTAPVSDVAPPPVETHLASAELLASEWNRIHLLYGAISLTLTPSADLTPGDWIVVKRQTTDAVSVIAQGADKIVDTQTFVNNGTDLYDYARFVYEGAGVFGIYDIRGPWVGV